MFPGQYKARYEKMKIARSDGGIEAVSVNQYRLRSSKNYNETMLNEFLGKLNQKGGPDIPKLTVDTGDGRTLTIDRNLNTVANWVQGLTGSDQVVGQGPDKNDYTGTKMRQDILADFKKKGSSYRELEWALMARYVFAGKGAPEHCQIVLQLAAHWKLKNAGPGNLQAYADAGMGLDCNGFVGNYRWHVTQGHPWFEQGIAGTDLGPDATIDSFFRAKRVMDWNKIIPGITYIMGKVDDSGNVIKGGGSAAMSGHIVITQANEFAYHSDKESLGRCDLKVVESTASTAPGLTSSFYNFTAQKGTVFTVKSRNFVRQPPMKVVICPLT